MTMGPEKRKTPAVASEEALAGVEVRSWGEVSG